MINSRGFSLIEVTVTVAIIAILSAGLLYGVTEARQKARDTDRIADLRTLQSAIELYKQKNGRYPAGCRGANQWSGQEGTSYACASGQQYIIGLAPEFIAALPRDPLLNGAQSGYVYTTNTNGTVYKLMAKKTVESEVVTYAHKLKSCDATNSGQVTCTNDTQPKDPINDARCDIGMCDRVHDGYSKPAHCEENNADFSKTYAVWGGYAQSSDITDVARLTEDVVCEIP